MLRTLSLVTTIIVSLCTLSLGKAPDMEKAAEKYVKSLLREAPELCGELTTTKAREERLSQMKADRLLQLTLAEKNKLEDRDEVVSDTEYTKQIEALKQIKAKDPEVTFLIANSDLKRIDGELRLIMSRVITSKLAADETQSKQQLRKLLSAIIEYRKENKKYPASLADLNLSEEEQTFHGQPWIYLGGQVVKLRVGNAPIILVEPHANADGSMRAIATQGGFHQITQAQIDEFNAKLKELQENPSKTAPVANDTNHKDAVASSLRSLTDATLAYQKKEGKRPASWESLNISAEQRLCPAPANTTQKDWILLPETVKISVRDSVIMIVSPYPVLNGKHVASMTNGSMAFLSAKQFKKITSATP